MARCDNVLDAVQRGPVYEGDLPAQRLMAARGKCGGVCVLGKKADGSDVL